MLNENQLTELLASNGIRAISADIELNPIDIVLETDDIYELIEICKTVKAEYVFYEYIPSSKKLFELNRDLLSDLPYTLTDDALDKYYSQLSPDTDADEASDRDGVIEKYERFLDETIAAQKEAVEKHDWSLYAGMEILILAEGNRIRFSVFNDEDNAFDKFYTNTGLTEKLRTDIEAEIADNLSPYLS